MASLVSVNVGVPRDVEWEGKTVHTAVWKEAVPNRVMARRLNIDGDAQGDLAGHGGEHRAVMVYQIESYEYWQKHLGRNDFVYGQFGENLTVMGLPDSEVCIGDRYRIGSAVFEVTQPRVTCYRVGIRMNDPQMPALLVSHKRPGFYFRVIEEGEIGAGDEIVKVLDGPERMSVADVDGLLYLPGHAPEALVRALRVPALSDGWKGSLQALLNAGSTGGNAGLSPSPEALPLWTGFRTLRVSEVQQECDEVRSFTLATGAGDPLPASVPGQFLVVKLRPGQETPILRSYSISGASGLGTYRISVKRGSGSGSRSLYDEVRTGDSLLVSAPRGSFTLRGSDRPIVLLSAGIGATPVLSILHGLAAKQASPARRVWWCYGTRSSSEHPFAQEVRNALEMIPDSRSFVAYSKPGGLDRLGIDCDVFGRLSVLSLKKLEVPKDAEFYLCGPAGFLTEFVSGLTEWGVAPANIHSEAFGAGPSLTPGITNSSAKTPHAPDGTKGAGPIVSFTRSGLAVPWDSKFGSLLEFAEACDVPVRWSCRVGVCHTCESGIIDGRVDYAPDPLDRPAQGKVLICCAKPLSEIELDL
ncbi:MOSC and FAD-binding oxidoreductase domain-containing protein [soil metagenome]